MFRYISLNLCKIQTYAANVCSAIIEENTTPTRLFELRVEVKGDYIEGFFGTHQSDLMKQLGHCLFVLACYFSIQVTVRNSLAWLEPVHMFLNHLQRTPTMRASYQSILKPAYRRMEQGNNPPSFNLCTSHWDVQRQPVILKFNRLVHSKHSLGGVLFTDKLK